MSDTPDVQGAITSIVKPVLDAYPTHHDDDWFVMVVNNSEQAAADVEVEVERADGTVLTSTFDRLAGRPREQWGYVEDHLRADAGDPAPEGTPDELPATLRRVTWRYSDAFGLARYEHELTWSADAESAERVDALPV